jgi:ABC-type lipoprotein export system ATPase subunit
MVKLKRLKIDQFRNVTPGTELRFRDTFNVLLGKNGTGKTTLLNLIVSVLSWNFEPLLGIPFSVEYDLEAPEARATVQLRNTLVGGGAPLGSRLIAEAQGIIPEARGILEGALLASSERYESSGEIILSGQSLHQEQVLKFVGSNLSLCRPDGTVVTEWSSSVPIVGVSTMWNIARILVFQEKTLRHTAVMGSALIRVTGDNLGVLRRFDESLEYLNCITQSEKAFDARATGEKRLYSVGFHGGASQAIAKRIGQQLMLDPDVDEISMGTEPEGTEFLERVIQLLGFKSAKLRLQRTARKTEPQEIIDFGNMRFDFTKRDRSIINHTQLSYGQKRLLSFYYYLACSPACVVADELVNGMHHEWIEACLNDLGERQSFLTSQNPLLLDYLGFESVDEVRSSFVLCLSELQGDREILRWENMTAEDAEGFFGAYQVGIQHVSEILRTRGLW